MSQRLRRWAVELFLIAVALLLLRAYQTRAHVQGPAPRAIVHTLAGKSVTLGGAGSEPYVIHFWATWCGVCRAEEGSIAHMAEGANVVTVASRSGSSAAVREYMRSRKLGFPVIDDSSGTLAEAWGVRAFPTTFFVDRKGVIAMSEVGYTTYLGLKLRLWLASW
jgi:thiol-disulfide isomerase/thioredoxin